MNRPASRPTAFAATLCAALLGTSPVAVFAASLKADSRISAVTVYTDRAVVTRTAVLDLTANGIFEVNFERLPSSLIEESITVAGKGMAQVTILDISGEEKHVDFTPNERIKAIEDELRALLKQKRALDDRGTVLKAQEASLVRLEGAATTAPTKDGAPRLSIEESLKLLSFLEEQRTKLAAERQSLDTQLEDLAAKQSAAQKRLDEIRGRRWPQLHPADRSHRGDHPRQAGPRAQLRHSRCKLAAELRCARRFR